jgi:ABC-type polysaccharide/polyol phosphate export permease
VLVPISALPPDAQGYLMWNPLVHPIELSRRALFPHYFAGDAGLLYPFVVAIILLAIGLTLFHGSRNFMSQR